MSIDWEKTHPGLVHWMVATYVPWVNVVKRFDITREWAARHFANRQMMETGEPHYVSQASGDKSLPLGIFHD